MKRSYDQLRLYHGYVKQLRQANEIKVNVDGQVFQFRFSSIKEPRYILKALDVELPIRNDKFPKESPNKNEFHNTMMEDLTHHLSWIRELLFDNGIIPFNEKNLYEGL